MEFKVLHAANADERRQWLDDLGQLPDHRRDVYFRPEYMQAYVTSPEVEACCAVSKEGTAKLMYPFLKSRIPRVGPQKGQDILFDIQSAYGYGGPVVNVEGEDAQFLEQAWDTFSTWCAEERIISEFVCFHPLVNNVRWAPKTMKVFEDRLTVPMMLETYEDELQNTSYYRRHRQMLNKAMRMDFSFHVMPADSALSWFVPLYETTQDFLQAGGRTQFGMDYFKALTEGLGQEGVWLGVIKQADEIVAAALVLQGPAYLHSHLMGYRRDLKTAGMTNLIYHGIAIEGAIRGRKILHMGGGLSGSDDDRLFRFKKSLSPERAQFSIGKLCHDQQHFNEVGQEWTRKNGSRPKNYFQFYRLPAPE